MAHTGGMRLGVRALSVPLLVILPGLLVACPGGSSAPASATTGGGSEAEPAPEPGDTDPGDDVLEGANESGGGDGEERETDVPSPDPDPLLEDEDDDLAEPPTPQWNAPTAPYEDDEAEGEEPEGG